jgi:hypothetical protein
MAQVNMSVNKLIAHMPEVILEVRKAADEVGLKAEALFASHDRPGRHSIEVTHDKVDSFVSLVGPDPEAVEFGHYTGKSSGKGVTRIRGHLAAGHEFVEGLHLLSRAADL